VDTVITCYRGSETDEKRVTAEIYDAGNAQQRDGDAKRTVGRSSLSPFFYLWCGVYCTRSCTSPVCFLLFFTKQKLGLGLALDRRGRLWSGDLPALSEANSRSTTEAVCGRASGRIAVSFFILFLEQIDR
jgi:hypothetical protein